MRKTLVLVSLAIIIGLSTFVIASQIESGVAIYKGWNLIYGFTPNSLNGQGFDFSHIKAIYTYIPTDNEYVRIYPSPENSKIDKFGDSYFEKQVMWVYSDATVEGELNGQIHFIEYWLEEPMPLSQRPISAGWNFVGITKDVIPGPQDTNLKDIQGNCNIEKSYLWNADLQKWEAIPIESAQLEEMSLGQGWVIKVSNNCNLGATSNVPSVPQLPNGESTPSTSSFEFPQTISGYTLFKTTDENTICVTEFYNLCLDPIKAEYRNSATGKVVFVQGNKITSGTNNDLKSIFANQVGGTLSTFMIGSNKVYKVENHEIFWFNADKSYVFIQEGAFTTSSTGTNFNYGNVDPNNEVIKYFLSKYPSINVD